MEKKVNEIRSARAVLGDVWKLYERGGAIQYLNDTPKCGCCFLLRVLVRVLSKGVGARCGCDFDGVGLGEVAVQL